MTTEYKGFTISETGTTGKFVISPDAVGFNLNGYATLNTAKGAITKHLNAQATVPAANVETDITTAGTAKVKLAGSDDKEYASVPTTAGELSRTVAECNVLAIRSEAGKVTANLRYNGLVRLDGTPRNRDKRSRNQREGGYAGKVTLYANHNGVVKKFRMGHVRTGNGRYIESLKAVAKGLVESDQGA